MKKRVIDFLKRSRIIYGVYYFLFSLLLKVAGLFIRPTGKSIVFVCYGGRKYGDNVKPIYLRMLRDERFKDWKFVWAFRNVNKFELPDTQRTTKVQIDTFRYYYHVLKSKCWITNVSVQRGLNFKRRSTLYVNTWHGVPLKLIGKCSKSAHLNNAEAFDLMLSEGTYDAPIYEKAFDVPASHVRVTGYPRNDQMFSPKNDARASVRKRYSVRDGETLILYAPTYRDYNKNESGGYTFETKLSLKTFQDTLGDGYKMMIRSHGAIEDSSANGEFIDVSDYPDVEDLLLASDVLVSDYSGIIFDYSLLEKPILCYAYDFDEYERERGFFVDLPSFLPFAMCTSEEELYRKIKGIDRKECAAQDLRFQEQCGLIKLNATLNAVNAIHEEMSKHGLLD